MFVLFLVKPSKPAPKQALRKLLNRIRSQRNDWTEPSHASAAEPPAVLTDEIPERDTSIDTGSLTSVEKSKLFPSAPGKSALTSAFLFKKETKKKPFDCFNILRKQKGFAVLLISSYVFGLHSGRPSAGESNPQLTN